MNLTVQKTSTKQESLMTYRGNELRSLFFQTGNGQPNHPGHHEELRAKQMVVTTTDGNRNQRDSTNGPG
jgi:hypothetical protein